MARSTGTYTAPENSVNPAVAQTTIDPGDFNDLVTDLETALTESVYTAGLGSTDDVLLRTDGTDTKKAQGSGVTCDDSVNVGGVLSLALTPVTVANLPGTPVTGMLAIVSDANATTARSTVAGGGANQVLVMRTAANWIIVA